MDQPSDDAFGRVTDPERYRPLHAVARALVAGLVAAYDVELEETAPVLRLTPASAAAAPIEVELSEQPIPGVRTRVGRSHRESHPRCGCDACDESVEDAADELHRIVQDVVGGAFHEWFDGRRLGFRAGSRAGWSLEAVPGGPPLGEPWTVDWAPWPRRPAASG